MPTIAAIILAKVDGKYLMVEENWGNFVGKMSLPGGEIDPGDESIFKCAVREGEEETGLIFNLLKVVGFYERRPSPAGERVFGLAFSAEIIRSGGGLNGETSRIGYFSVPEIREMEKRGLLRFSNILQIIEDNEAGKEFPLDLITVLS